MTKANTLFSLTMAAALCAGAASVVSAESADTKVAPPASAFTPIQRYAITYDQPRDLAEFYLRDFGLKTYGADIQQLDHPSDPKMRVLLVTIDPIKDPQVGAVQWRFDISSSEGSWSAESAGIRRKCVSGPKPDEWTTEVCP